MDFLNEAKRAVNNARGKVTDVDNSPKTLFEAHFKNKLSSSAWQVVGEDWYKVYPYQFEVVVSSTTQKTAGVTDMLAKIKGGKGTEASYFYTLPIPPQSLAVKPIMASKVTATMGGVVEETSPITFWMLQMAGAFGPGLGRDEDDQTMYTRMASQFRTSVSTTGLLSGISANLQGAVNKVGGMVDSLAGIAGGFQDGAAAGFAGAAGAVTGALNSTLTPPQIFGGSAVNQLSNGFTDAQEFSRFIYMYSKLKAAHPDEYSLYFISHKTKQKWQVVIREFSLQQSHQNPMMYRYTVALQGWDVKEPNKQEKAFDRFGPNGDLAPVLSFNPSNKGIQEKVGAKLRFKSKKKNNPKSSTGRGGNSNTKSPKNRV